MVIERFAKFNLWDKFTEEEKTDYASLTGKEAQNEFMRLKWQREILCRFWLLVYVLGYRDTGEFHKKQIDELGKIRFINKDTPSIRRLWLWSRGFFKTSLISEAHSIYLIINNPNIRILLASYTMDIVKKTLAAIKSHFTNNPEFRYFFREYCPQPNTVGKIEFGTQEAFTIPNRLNKKQKEPTIMCAGVGTNLTGLHFDYMKPDDLVTRDSVTNDTQIQASKDYFSALRQLFDNPSMVRQDVIGTIYHFNDLHCDLLKNPSFIYKSIIPIHDEDEVYAFPERIDRLGFARIRNDPSMSPYDVSSQYLLSPHDPKDAMFKQEWWDEYDELPEGGCQYINVDPASTQKKKSDYSVLERWDVGADGKHRLVEGIRDKMTAFQRIDCLFEMVERSTNLKWVKYEVLGGRHGDLEVIKQRQQDKQKFFDIRETKSTNASKSDRIEQRLTGPWSSGVVLMPKNSYYRSYYDGKTYDFVQDYKLEFLQYSRQRGAEHDDCLDAHSQMFEDEVIKGKMIENKKEPEGMTFGEYTEAMEDDKAEWDSDPWGHFGQVRERCIRAYL